MTAPTALLLKEVADRLSGAGDLHCSMQVALHGNTISVSIEVTPNDPYEEGQGLKALELFYVLARLRDIGTLRSLATTYDIDPAKLEALLPKEDL